MDLRLSANVQGEVLDWTIERSPARLGRSSSNAVQLADASVSREHAELVRDGAEWSLRDLGSRNGTRVNGEEATDWQPVKPGDWIEVGHVMLRVGLEGVDTAWQAAEGHRTSARVRVADLLQQRTETFRDPGRLVRLLAEAGQLLVMPRPLQETCDEILRFVGRALPASRLVILLKGRDGRGLEQIAARSRGTEARDPLALSSTIVELVLDENTAVLTDDATQDPRLADAKSIAMQMIHSAIAVPLFDNTQVLGILYADSTDPGVIFGEQDLEMLTLLGNMAAVKISNSRLLESEASRLRMAQELGAATRIQQTLLPQAAPEVPGWQCQARLETCYEVGGDLYDFHRRSDGLLVFLVGDVSGKGMGAALLMSSALSCARVLYEICDDPLALVERLNRAISPGGTSRAFVTLFVGYLDPATGALRYVNAGHPEPLISNGDGIRGLPATGIPVGMLESFPWTQGEATIEPGEMLAVFSDGIPEAQQGEQFFDLERLEAALREAGAHADLARAAETVIERVDAFSAGQHRSDDLTLLLLRRGPRGGDR